MKDRLGYKVIHGIAVAATILAIPSLLEPQIWTYPQTWLMVVIAILATVFQPAYRATEGSRTAEDRGTATQIVWSIYVTQLAAFIEAAVVRYPQSFSWDVASTLAVVAIVGGLVVRSWAVITLGRYFTWNVEVQQGQGVVRRGPYRFVRHPSYTGALMTYVGTTVLLHSWWSLSLAAVALPLAFWRRIRIEERVLCRELSGYGDYSRDVKALIPWVG